MVSMVTMNARGLKLSRSFTCLNATQFLGALNDNIFKLLIILFLIGGRDSQTASRVTAIAGAVFVVPFLLFSAFAGRLADGFSKRDIVVTAKVAEVLIMSAGCVAFFFGNKFLLYGILFVMATQSAFFGPSKYGIIRELVTDAQLSRANGLLEAFTYLAIVIGAAFGPMLAQVTGDRYAIAAFVCVVVAAAGLTASVRIKRTKPAGARSSASVLFIRDIWRTFWSIRKERRLLLAVFASAGFLLVGAFIYMNLIPYGMEQMGLGATSSGYLFVLAAIGIGTGAFLAGKISGRGIQFGVVPLAAFGLSCSSIGIGLVSGSSYLVFVLIFLAGISAGLFIVPIHTFIQLRSPDQRRGQILAASSFLGWVGVLLASGAIYVFSQLWKMSAANVFLVLGIVTLVPAVAAVIVLADHLFRLGCLVLTRLCYRIKVVGIDNIPVDSGALLVCNHITWIDALLLNAAQPRRIRFVIDKHFYNKTLLRPICKLVGAIPISAHDPPKKIVAALREARAAMAQGWVVCIFAEGVMTRNGTLGTFKSGFKQVMKGSSYQIIPAHIGGAWPSIFSYYYGKPLTTFPKKFRRQISVHFGKPMPSGSTASQIRQQVLELSCEYFNDLKLSRRSLGENFVKTARKNWRKKCICDSTTKPLNYGRTLTSSIALADQIDKLTKGQEKIGILLPPSVGGALANLAVTIQGKVAVNLSYVVSDKDRQSAVDQCGIKCIISSRRFAGKFVDFDTLPSVVFLEDIVSTLTPASKLKAYLKARFLPLRAFGRRRFCRHDLATIIFSSGSTGKPKGVMLSHHNICSNVEALQMIIRLKGNDDMCTVLPFFHCFGFTCGLWLPLTSGISTSFVANGLDGRVVGQTVDKNRSTLLFAPPTFLSNYIRRAHQQDFATLRLLAAGAEKLKKGIADAFEKKFAIRPFEGYGATELSPVASLNVPDIEAGGIHQVGNKPGSVGHTLPGVAVKIVDSSTNELLPIGSEGLLMVKGPNVMLGYLNNEEETAKVLKDGWYNTGDIARIDDDGFLTITDRLSRFSKIAGEMVPHSGVEQVYLNALNTHEQIVAVTGIPEPKKGEELVILYLEQAGKPDKLHEIVTKSKLPNIWKPRPDNYIKIESMPLLGSGKLDVRRLKEIALAAKEESFVEG